jgi:poly(3-hydroxybutyrate) depolymerase
VKTFGLYFASLLLCVACSSDGGGDDDDTADAPPTGGPDAPPGAPDAPNPGGPDAPPTSWPCEPAVMSGHQEVDCPDGVHYDVDAPASCTAGGCGMIVDIHGLTSTADEEDQHTRMRAMGTAAGYVVVQPTSPGNLHEWSSGDWDDFVWTFVQATRDRFGIDPDRVHVMGFSQGGMMTLRLICAHSDEIASAAPAAGGACWSAGGSPAVPVPFLYTHGTSDNIVPYVQGTAVRDGAIADWNLGSEEVFASGALYTATRWRDGDGDVMLEFWSHDFTAEPIFGFEVGGHCLPGPLDGGTYRCEEAGQFDLSVEVLRFFDEHPRE